MKVDGRIVLWDVVGGHRDLPKKRKRSKGRCNGR